MNRIKSLAISNSVFFLIAFGVSMLSQVSAINSKDIGDISNKYDTLFTPAGITFSIWGLIYVALFAFSIYHIYKAFREDALSEANKDTNRMGVLFIVNNIATAAWVFAWVNEQFILSVLLMLTQLVTLVVINVKLKYPSFNNNYLFRRLAIEILLNISIVKNQFLNIRRLK